MQPTTLLSPSDGFALDALSATPNVPIGGVVVIQEIFGLSDHIGEICDRFAGAGYAALAPGLFSRIGPDFHASLDAAGFDKGRNAVANTPLAQAAADIQAAIDTLPKPCYIVGFCYGGALSWLAAARCNGVKAASCFYGRMIADLLEETPLVPVMLHYGANDATIPPDNYERVRAASPASPLYLYDAGHGFCRKASHDYNEAACELALERTLDWFARWR